MIFLTHFYRRTLKFDLINKFLYKNTKELPKLKKIILNFGCNNNEIKNLAASLLALELIANQKGILTLSKKSNISLKIRKGNPVGCKVTLQKTSMFDFITKTLIDVYPKLKNFHGFNFNSRKLRKKTFSYEIEDTFSFPELETNYSLFNNYLPKLSITFVVSSKSKEELLFILKSLQIPLKLSKQI